MAKIPAPATSAFGSDRRPATTLATSSPTGRLDSSGTGLRGSAWGVGPDAGGAAAAGSAVAAGAEALAAAPAIAGAGTAAAAPFDQAAAGSASASTGPLSSISARLPAK